MKLSIGIKSLVLACVSSLLATTLQATTWYNEKLYDEYAQSFRMDKVIYEEKTEHQDLVIFENERYGKVLALDGIIQLTESDEYVYHEMMTHVPIISHGNVKSVLVIGGGDGGILREVLKHSTVEKATLVEIDSAVIEFSKRYLPSISKGAFESPKVEVVIADGCKFVKDTTEKYDVIICDSTDPIGPGEVLFTPEFYSDCRNALSDGGIFVNQNGVPFMQADELISTYKSRSKLFSDAGYYVGVVPTYIGGFMAFGWATDNLDYRSLSAREIEKRMENISGELKYYTPAIHKASFALPKFIEKHLEEKS